MACARPVRRIGCLLIACAVLQPALGNTAVRYCDVLDLKRSFSDGFEVNTLSELVPSDGSRWSGFQITGAGGTIELSSTVVHSGARALRLAAAGTAPGAGLVKLDVFHNDLCFRQGDEVWASAWFFIEPTATPLDDLTIWDLEAPDAIWPTVGSINPPEGSLSVSPGRRLAVRNGHALEMESKAMAAGLRDFEQPASTRVPLPTGRWVGLVVHMRLSGLPDGRGLTEVWQDGTLIIHGVGINFPYGGYAPYRSLQVGVSANSRPEPVTVFVDDVSIFATNSYSIL